METSKSCDLNVANCGRDTESKTSPRHLTFEAAEENHRDERS